jgi:hypothetical protein
MYPPVPAGVPFAGCPADFNGARMLCRALIAPGPGEPAPANMISDGAGSKPPGSNPTDPTVKETLPGPGFRTRGTTGRVYGPYLPPDRFKLGDPSGTNRTEPGFMAILDRYNRPILYYPATGKPNIRVDKSYAWVRSATDKPMFNIADNAGARDPAMSPKIPNNNVLGLMLGDLNGDGKITSPEEPAFEGSIVLWSSGPDEIFGPPAGPDIPAGDVAGWRKAIEKSDDVTNFRTP